MPENKRSTNRRARKERITQAALDLFRQQGYDETRVEDITQAAGVAKGTFFNYFANKEEVLLYISERHMSRLGAALMSDMARQDGQRQAGLATLKLMLHALAESLAQDRDLVQLTLEKAMRMSHLAPQPGAGHFSFRSLAIILIGRTQRDGDIHPSLDPEPLAEIIEGLYYHHLALWCQQDFGFDLGERLEQIVDLLVVGIGARRAAG